MPVLGQGQHPYVVSAVGAVEELLVRCLGMGNECGEGSVGAERDVAAAGEVGADLLEPVFDLAQVALAVVHTFAELG